MRYIKHLVRRYPLQSFLILFNAGVFTWLQTTGTMIAYRLDLSGDDIWIYIPTWVNTLTSHSLESIRTLIWCLRFDLANDIYDYNLVRDFS